MDCPVCGKEMKVRHSKDGRGIKFNHDRWQCPKCREKVPVDPKNAGFIVRIAGGYAITFMGDVLHGVFAIAQHELKPTVFDDPEEAAITARSRGLAVGHFEIFPIKKPL